MLANPAGGVYGAIMVGALLAAESARRETYAKTVLAVVITLLLYWLAHSYAEGAGRRLRDGGRLTVAGLARTMGHEVSILIGSALPLLVLLFLWAAGASLASAVKAAVWTSAIIIVVIEVVAARRARLEGRELVGQVALGALLGLMVVVLRILLH
jgi:hypothetical protein